MLTRTLATALIALSSSFAVQAQLETPAASPRSVLKQTVGLTEVEIDYSRPGVKDRQIFGSLVPFGEVWRTGANSPTKISFSDDVTLGGAAVPAGVYALYTIPGESEWTIIIYTTTDQWGAYGYDQSKDLVRFVAPVSELAQSVESFTIGIDYLRNDSATVHLDWANTRVAFPLEVPTSQKVLSQIDELQGTPEFQKPGTLFAAGSYYHESGKDLEQALEWVSEACEKRKDPAFWMFARKARIEVDLGLTDAARSSAERTLELATAARNRDYQKIANDILASL